MHWGLLHPGAGSRSLKDCLFTCKQHPHACSSLSLHRQPMRLGQPHCTGPTPDNISRPHRSYDPQNLESPIKVLHSPSYIHAKPEHVSTKGQTAWQNARSGWKRIALGCSAPRKCEYVQDQSGVWKICIFGLGGLRNPNPLSYNSTCFPSRKPFFQTRNPKRCLQRKDVWRRMHFCGICGMRT